MKDNGAEIVCRPLDTLIRHSLIGPLVEDKVSVWPAAAAIV